MTRSLALSLLLALFLLAGAAAQELDWNSEENPDTALAERDFATAIGSGVNGVSEGKNDVPGSDLLKVFLESRDRELFILNKDYDSFYLIRKGDDLHFVSDKARGAITQDNIPAFLAIIVSALAPHYDRGLQLTPDGRAYQIEPAQNMVSNPFSLTGTSFEYSHHPLTGRLMLFLASNSDGRFLLINEVYDKTAQMLEFVRKDGSLTVTFPDGSTRELPPMVSMTAYLFTVQALNNFNRADYSVFVGNEQGSIADAVGFVHGETSGRFMTIADMDGTVTALEVMARKGEKPRARFTDESGEELLVFEDGSIILTLQVTARLLEILAEARELVLTEKSVSGQKVIFDSKTAGDRIFPADLAAYVRRKASGSLHVVDARRGSHDWTFDQGRISLQSGSGLVEMPVELQLALMNGIELIIPNLKEAQKMNRASSCEQNLRELGTAIKLYYENNGQEWPRELSVLEPVYLRQLPQCPEAGKDTYTRGYRVAGKEAIISCKGLFHTHPDMPLWTSMHGVLTKESEVHDVHFAVDADSVLTPDWSLSGEWLALATHESQGFAVSLDGSLVVFDADGNKLLEPTELELSEAITDLRVANYGDGGLSLLGFQGWGRKLFSLTTEGVEEFVHETESGINDVLCFDMLQGGVDLIFVGYNGAGGIELLTPNGESLGNLGGANIWDLEPGASVEGRAAANLLATHAKGDIMDVGFVGEEFETTIEHIETPVYSKYVRRLKSGGYLTAGRNAGTNYLLRLTAQGSVMWEAPLNGGSIDEVQLSPDSRWVALSMTAGPTYLIDIESGQVKARTKAAERLSRCAWLDKTLVVTDQKSISGYSLGGSGATSGTP